MTVVSHTFGGLADWDRDGYADMVVRDDRTGDVWVVPGDGRRTWSSQQKAVIGTGFWGHTFGGLADWDRDGYADMVVRDDRTGDVWLVPGDGRRTWSHYPKALIGTGF